jgi:hypothetical protein
MSTGTVVINRTLRQMLSGTVEQRNKLATALSNTTGTSVVCSYDLDGLRAGAVFEIDSELFYVWEANSGTKTLTVERGFNGTTAATHSAGAVITLSPRFPRSQVLEALNDELRDLSSPMHGLFQIKYFDLDYNGSDVFINLPPVAEILDILSVHVRYLADEYIQIRKYKLVRDMPTDDFSSSFALKFEQPARQGRLRIVYKAPFTTLTNEGQSLVNYAGLPASCEDIVNLGVQIRMMAPRELKRNFTESQGDTRRPEEVPVGGVTSSLTQLIRMRRDRITAESARLKRQYPTFLTKD